MSTATIDRTKMTGSGRQWAVADQSGQGVVDADANRSPFDAAAGDRSSGGPVNPITAVTREVAAQEGGVAGADHGLDELAIFVVDDDAAVRESTLFVLEGMSGTIESYPTAEQFLLTYLRTSETSENPLAGCVVLDVRMSGMSGLELHREILRRKLPLSVLFITGHGDVPLSVEAMRQGAIDVLVKPVEADTLRERVREGLRIARRDQMARELTEMVERREAVLTAREHEVYKLLLQGLETKQIGHRLGISPSTVEKHRLKVFDKMGVDTVPRLIRFVFDSAPEKVAVPPVE